MQSPRRALLYGPGVWLGLVVISLILLPAEGKNEALYESIKLTALVGVTLTLTIRYLSKVRGSSLGEGALVGVVWAAIVVALDLVLYAFGAFNIGLDVYFSDVASSYLAIPVITTLAMGYLRR
jgi:hypothetical protein